MKRIRIGKDISMRWEITTDGVAIPLDGRDLTVEIKSPMGIENNIPYRVDGNILIMTYYGYEQKRTGEYSITLWEKKGKPGQNVVDVIRAFELVRTSQEEDDFVGGDLQIESVDLGTENFDILTEGGYRAINIDTLQADALEDSVNIKGKTYSNESFTITLPKANLDSAGVMSASDKQTLQEHGNRIAQINTTLEEHTESINANITTDRIEDGAVTSEKIATSAFDDTLSVSGKIAPADVVGEKLSELDTEINGIERKDGSISTSSLKWVLTTGNTNKHYCINISGANSVKITASDHSLCRYVLLNTYNAVNGELADIVEGESINDMKKNEVVELGIDRLSAAKWLYIGATLSDVDVTPSEVLVDGIYVLTKKLKNEIVQLKENITELDEEVKTKADRNYVDEEIAKIPISTCDYKKIVLDSLYLRPNFPIVGHYYVGASGSLYLIKEVEGSTITKYELVTPSSDWLYIYDSHIYLYSNESYVELYSEISDKVDDIKKYKGWVNSNYECVSTTSSTFKIVSVKAGQKYKVVANDSNNNMTVLLQTFDGNINEGDVFDAIEGSRKIGSIEGIIPEGCNYLLFGISYSNSLRTPKSLIIEGYDFMLPVIDNVRNASNTELSATSVILQGMMGYVAPNIKVGDLYVDGAGNMQKVDSLNDDGSIATHSRVQYNEKTIYLFLDNIYVYNGKALVKAAANDNQHKVEVSAICLDTDTPTSEIVYPVLCAVKVDNSKTVISGYGEHSHELPVGWLYYDREKSDDVYYSGGVADRLKKLFTWDKSVSNGKGITYYSPCICPNGDIFFVPRAENNADRSEPPILYKASENYQNPIHINALSQNSFGEMVHPGGWFGNSGLQTITETGDVIFGEYVRPHHEPANVWKVSAPYDNPDNWRIVYATTGRGEGVREIEHFHSVNYDPFTGRLYIATGDLANECKILMSTDNGDTWSVVYDAAGDEQRRSMARALNFVFTKDACYYGSDNSFFLIRAIRGEDGLIDWETLERVVDRNYCNRLLVPSDETAGVTYFACLIDKPFGVLLLQRNESTNLLPTNIFFYDIKRNDMQKIYTFDCVQQDGARAGFRCDAVNMYQSPSEKRIVCGFGNVANFNEMAGNNGGIKDVRNLTLKVE